MAQFYADRVAVGSHRAITPEGYLLVKDVPIARSGVQVYRAEEVDKDGSLGLTGLVEVFRPKEEIFTPAAIASFEGKSVTCPHPPQFLTPDNDGHYARGHVQNVRPGTKPLPDGNWPVIADLLVKDRTTMSQVENNIFRQLSAGYSYDLAPMEGSTPEKPKFKQVNIRGNHVALVAAGRAGDHVQVLDSSPVEEQMEGEVVKPGLLSELGSFFRELTGSGYRLVAADAESETVKRQEEIAKKSNSLKERTLDMKTKDADELEKEEEKAKKSVEGKDEEEEAEKKKEAKEAKDARQASDALLRTIADGITKLVKASDAKKVKDADEEEEEEEKKEAAEDSDLIPVETLSGKEVPENPIPGADAALAGLRSLRPVIAGLRSLRPVIAESGDRQAIDTFNGVMLVLKGKVKATDSAYKSLLNTKKPEDVKTAEDRARLTAKDAKPADDTSFFDSARKFHRQNPNEVKPN